MMTRKADPVFDRNAQYEAAHAAFLVELDKASADREAAVGAANLAYERAVDKAWERRDRRVAGITGEQGDGRQ